MANYDKSFEYYYSTMIDDICDELRAGREGYVYSMAQAKDVARRVLHKGWNGDVKVCGVEDGVIILRGSERVGTR